MSDYFYRKEDVREILYKMQRKYDEDPDNCTIGYKTAINELVVELRKLEKTKTLRVVK